MCFQTYAFEEICIPQVELTNDDFKRISEVNISPENPMQNHLYCYLYSKNIFQNAIPWPKFDRKAHLKGLVDPTSSDLKDRAGFEERHKKIGEAIQAY